MDVVTLIAQAIGFAEGYGADPTNRPTRNNNPGDMTADLIGKKVGMDGPFVVYATPEDGWANLYAQINEWLNGTSRVAGPSSTLADLASHYAPGQPEWLANVAAVLGVDPNITLGSIASTIGADFTAATAQATAIVTQNPATAIIVLAFLAFLFSRKGK